MLTSPLATGGEREGGGRERERGREREGREMMVCVKVSR